MFKKTAIATAVFLAATAHAQMVGTGATRTTIENYAVTKYLSQTGVPAAWARGFTGRGSIVAVLDQGFDLTQADIKNNVLAFKNFQAGSTVLNWGLHGTQMASIVAAQQNGWGTVGVAPDAKLLLGQIGNGGTSTYINTSAMIQGMYWAEANGANVISLSLGASYYSKFQ
jgi:subtilisin family serine protease